MVDVWYVERHAGLRLRGCVQDSYTIRRLRAVAEEEVGMDVSCSVVCDWLGVYGSDPRFRSNVEADVLESAYGSELRLVDYASAWALAASVRNWMPSVSVTKSGAEAWIRRWGCVRDDEGIYGARQLDDDFGDALRGVEWADGMSAEAVLRWLLRKRHAQVSLRVCAAWVQGRLEYVVCFDASRLDLVSGAELAF